MNKEQVAEIVTEMAATYGGQKHLAAKAGLGEAVISRIINRRREGYDDDTLVALLGAATYEQAVELLEAWGVPVYTCDNGDLGAIVDIDRVQLVRGVRLAE